MSFTGLYTSQLQSETGAKRPVSSARLFVTSFAALIAVGTLGFLVLPGMYTGASLGWVDALFLSTSAVCVTGLALVDLGTYLTPFGQFWLLLLVQLGGLGILSLTALAMARIGRASLSLEEAGGAGPIPLRFVDETALLRTVVTVTFSVEAVGAAFLWLDWQGQLGAGGALWPAVFHAVSAFCNAGFSLFKDNLASVRTSPVTLGVVSALIVVGGLGFVVIEDLRAILRRTTPRLSVHTRLVLVSTAGLLAVGSVLFLVLEWHRELGDLTPLHKVTNAFFMSVTPRTAGFNTVNYGSVSNASLFLTILLMVIGGSPGGTAGGLKTVTMTTLLLALWARMHGRQDVTAFGRSIPPETVGRAAGLAVGALVLLGTMVFLLALTDGSAAPADDRTRFIDLVFEAHSAFGTVGLSTGITSSTTPAGRLILSFLMFAGRVGPAALVASMVSAADRRRAAYRFGREDVMIA